MNEDFGVGRRRRVTEFDVVPRQASIDISKYQPASRITPRSSEPEAIAITMDDPYWDNNSMSSADDIVDSSGNDYGSDGPSDSPSNDSGSQKPEGSADPEGNNGDKPSRNPFKRLVLFLRGLSRKQWLIIGSIVLILAAGGTSYALTRPDKPLPAAAIQKKKVAPVPPPKPTSPLTGLETTDEDTKRPVIGVMIENSTFARPQSGFKDAGVVFEAIAEYGITRFLALYQEGNPANIGPVRSARPYYVDWARSFDAAYGHVGGSPDALAKIKAEGIRDLDQFANSGSYHRISQRDAPHNVYTSMQDLRGLTAAKGWANSTFTGFSRTKEKAAATVTAEKVDFAISGPTYNVHYDYDKATNSYLRTMGGEPHNDSDSGTRLAPKVVIGMATSYSLMPDGYHSAYATTGSGAVKIFQNGTVTEGTWKREGTETYKFTDAAGKPIALNPGQTWITVVGDPAAITFTPAPAATPPPAATPAP